MRIRAVIFDMDGLLVDTEPLHHQSWKTLFKDEFHRPLPSVYKKILGQKEEEVMTQLVNSINVQANVKELVKIKHQIYHDLIRRRVTFMPGARELINDLKGRYMLALSTSSTKECADIILRKLQIEDVFDAIATGDDVREGKPHPEIYHFIRRMLEIAPSECLVLEDTENGVNSAKNAGMWCIAVPNQYTKHGDFSRANLIVESLAEMNHRLLESFTK
ncbi:HAD family hydrolase [[Eubacterium] cellulosolvens]